LKEDEIMSDQITKKDLQQVVDGINRRAGHPEGTGAYTEYEEGIARSTLGWYYLQGEYGGWKLYQKVNRAGGVRDVLGVGAVPKRIAYYLMRAYARGLDDGIVDSHYSVAKITERASGEVNS
jgi:hypothetical protein